MGHIHFLAWFDRFLTVQKADTLEIWIIVAICFAVLGPFAAMTFHHFAPRAARRVSLLQGAALVLLAGAWLLLMTRDFTAAVDHLLPLSRPGRAEIMQAMALVTALVFAQLQLLQTPREAPSAPGRRRTRVASP